MIQSSSINDSFSRVLLEQHTKTGGLEVFIIGERLDDSKPTHHDERNLINDSSLARIAS